MIKFFRHIRQSMIKQNRASKYLLYAFGEIILVVIGILIALQINNWNEDRKERLREVSYLKNLKTDLASEIDNNDRFATYRYEKAEACAILLNGVAPNTIEQVQDYTDTYERVFVWQTYVPNNNTFKELLSSGNLSLIKNDAIKNALLKLDVLYANLATGEDHMRREYEAYLYDPHVENVIALGFFDLSKGAYGFPKRLRAEDLDPSKGLKLINDAQWQHNSPIFKNGLRLALMNNSFLAGMHKDLVHDINNLIVLIDKDISKS